MRLFLLCLATTCALACDAPELTSERHAQSSSDINAQLDANSVTIENRTARRLYYLVYDPRVLAMYALCIGPGCPHVDARSSVVVPGAAITGWSPDVTEVQLVYWRLASDGSGSYRAEDVRSLLVKR